jgi:hypothetical protein
MLLFTAASVHNPQAQHMVMDTLALAFCPAGN